jgi:TonB family protein
MFNSLFIWVVDQQVIISSVLLGIICLERFSVKQLSPNFVYKLFLLVPLALIMYNLPDTFKPVVNSQISYYFISSDIVKIDDFNWVWNIAYCIGVVVLLAYALTVHCRFVSKLHLRPLTSCPSKLEYLGDKTYVSTVINTPMVLGLLHSKLILPAEYEKDFSKPSLALVLEHELVHMKRKDNLTSALFLLLCIVFWFNPLLWLAYGSFRRLQELSCDQRVLRDKTLQQQILYSKTLINCAANSPSAFITYSHYGDKKMILKRLMQIKNQGKTSKVAKGALLCTAAVLLSSLAIANSPVPKADDNANISPIKRVDPNYPAHAIENGQSGSVVLKFDITPSGTTTNISVVSDAPKGVFNREAKKSLVQWQYEPSAQGAQNVLVQLDFALDTQVVSAPLVERVTVVK